MDFPITCLCWGKCQTDKIKTVVGIKVSCSHIVLHHSAIYTFYLWYYFIIYYIIILFITWSQAVTFKHSEDEDGALRKCWTSEITHTHTQQMDLYYRTRVSGEDMPISHDGFSVGRLCLCLLALMLMLLKSNGTCWAPVWWSGNVQPVYRATNETPSEEILKINKYEVILCCLYIKSIWLILFLWDR